MYHIHVSLLFARAIPAFLELAVISSAVVVFPRNQILPGNAVGTEALTTKSRPCTVLVQLFVLLTGTVY